MDQANSALLTDLYQLNMLQAYVDHGETGAAVFEFFVRRLPARRGFLLAAGLESALTYLENLHFSPGDIDWLKSTGRFSPSLLDYLRSFRFTGEVHAMPEGTVFFPDEPILRVVAPLPEAQVVETRLVNLMHYQTLIASKAARMVLAAPSKQLIDFGLRSAHGAEAGLLAARASYLAGFAGTATVLAGKCFGIPIFGTMAHSFIVAHDRESVAFENFARAQPDNVTLLIDSYDTEAGACKVVALAPRLRASGIRIRGVRIDSGDLIDLSKKVRHILDAGGLGDVTIIVSGGVDEDVLTDLAAAGAPIDGFGIGSSLTTSSDAPALDCVYKLQEYAGVARRKLSTGKATWPGRKQVWRTFAPDGRMSCDVLSVEDDHQSGQPLLQLVMKAGQRLQNREPLDHIRARAARNLGDLPEPLRQLRDQTYHVDVAPALRQLATEVDRRLAQADRID